MPTRNFTQTPTNELKGAARNAEILSVTWSGLLLNDDGQPLEAGAFSDRSIQFAGTFGTATIVLQGSNDGVNWQTLADPQGTAISKTSASIEAVLEPTRFVRPQVTGGDGTTNLTAILFARG